tara:strand:- start:5190 stop:6224 length:1035 start_codon:yes stop_codon:yes gene_type:complete
MKEKIKVGINGFGRIGRSIAKINAEQDVFDLKIINDINPEIENLAYLFRYDSTYGKFDGDVSVSSNILSINGKETAVTSFDNLLDVPWKENNIDLIIDASGLSSNIKLAKELTNSNIVKKVIITHSSTDTDCEIIMGVNDDILESKHDVVSNSICDANAIAHIMKWFDEEYQIENGSLTTLHPWLGYQNLVDGSVASYSSPGFVWKDYALGRSSVSSLIPKKTTAMSATEVVLPHLKNKIMSFSYRVPTSIVASSDITLNLSKEISKEELKDFLVERSQKSPYVNYNYESLTSVDYEKNQDSATIDLQWLEVNGKTVKIVLWYDNEWGYSSRVIDLFQRMSDYI